MKPSLIFSLFLQTSALFALGQAASAPSPATPARAPAASPSASPEILPDRHVTFRLKAPQANEVAVSGQGFAGRVPMSKDESGQWSATVGPFEPGIFEYSFTVDGVQMIDPGNSWIKPQRQPRTSILHIAGDPPQIWDFQGVPHGTLHEHNYQSKTVGEMRRFDVYTPPGYERDSTTKFPVLYLIHGFGDNYAAWSVHGKAHWILDNLIAQGRAAPMIVVMPDGHPIAPETRPRQEYGKANADSFEHELIDEIVPLVESTYRVRAEAAGRAIAGLSMGGGHSLQTGLRHLDTFAWIGAFSAGLPSQERLSETIANADALNQKLKLFWIACGKKDSLVERNRQFEAQLTEKGIHHTWRETEGDHSWPVWRRYLAEFAPLLFSQSSAK